MCAGEPDGARTLARRTYSPGSRLAGGAGQQGGGEPAARWAEQVCGTVRRWRDAAVSPRCGWLATVVRVQVTSMELRMSGRWIRSGCRSVEQPAVAGAAPWLYVGQLGPPAGRRPQAVQVVPGGPDLVPRLERGLLGPFGELAGRARPRPSTPDTLAGAVGCGVPAEHVLRIPPEQAVDNVDRLRVIHADQRFLPPIGDGPRCGPSTSECEGRHSDRTTSGQGVRLPPMVDGDPAARSRASPTA
jgi:hypothetical protein